LITYTKERRKKANSIQMTGVTEAKIGGDNLCQHIAEMVPENRQKISADAYPGYYRSLVLQSGIHQEIQKAIRPRTI
jgi:hypothetical protein